MAELDKRGGEQAAAEEERLLGEEAAVLDFDTLCSTVAMQAQQGKWGKLNGDNEEEYIVSNFREYGGGVHRMWEGELFYDCFDDRRLALQSSCCPCYRFGKNMKRAGFGSCFLQGGDTSFDDFVYHVICPSCMLSQESRTLEMNNVQDGIWHGRGDTICVGSFSEDSKAYLELHPPFVVSTKCPQLLSMQQTSNDTIILPTSVVGIV
ncbi:uncharacterized protein LOC130985621 isoform X2 [Salvia miltiorrhiza]|uniref:uncharacterized protein LOC130985621 isoform X2 n=1 Tax=Salvia miltiorrhiza TaxID=226208 RepID=UPI0025AD4BF7|nr:uncharacterized protein LOC130985621 isoform X2 [Salvia miltiorrhiza]